MTTMLETVYVARHGFRMVITHAQSAMALVRDPPLTAHGEHQAKDLAAFFASMPRDEQPQLIVSSPYSRCVTTAAPVAQQLGLAVMIEPGLAEWYPPVWPADSGTHPAPPSAATVKRTFPYVSTDWTPLLYPDPHGETVADLHARMYEAMQRIDARCTEWGVTRVLFLSHAASSIALGRMLLAGGDVANATHDIRVGTASVSKYTRDDQRWTQAYNGRTSFLPQGSEREWRFDYVPENNSEPGMGEAWQDPNTPADASLLYVARSRL